MGELTCDPDAAAGGRFVIQEHHASTLHWDFRLERGGVLVSWALPKGLPIDPTRNHLALHTEDHPLEYADFEGMIPAGEYGAGTVAIWDRGTYSLEKWTDREVKVVLEGSHARGRYVLFPTGAKQWMMHRMDPLPEGYAPMPPTPKPMLARTGALPPSDEGWAYEFKWDGIRAIVTVEGGRARAVTRNGNELSGAFPELAEIGEALGAQPAILDGELVAFDEHGRPNFGRLAHRLHVTSEREVRRRSTQVRATFLAFDLLYLDGQNLLSRTYDERRERLDSLALAGETFATPAAFREASGSAVLRAAADQGLEGIVAKQRHSPYRPGSRSGEWIKVKCFRTQEVIIGGWTAGRGERTGSLGSLLLGVFDQEGALRYAGKVGTGFDAATRDALIALLGPLAADTSPFVDRLPPTERATAHFVRPEIVGEVRFGEWTADGRLRHPSWRGLRTDKAPFEVVREP
jgi:bifunctional non-homologous end joining protein LigD